MQKHDAGVIRPVGESMQSPLKLRSFSVATFGKAPRERDVVSIWLVATICLLH